MTADGDDRGFDSASSSNSDPSPRFAERLLGSTDHVEPASSPSIPSRLGSFLIGERLGKGGMGEVRRAINESTGAEAAVKLVPEDDLVRAEALRREVRVLAAIDCPHVPKLMHAGHDEGFVWMALERILGNDLAVVLRGRDDDGLDFFEPSGSPTPHLSSSRQRIDEPELAKLMRWMHEVATALAALHRGGVAHRDVKPANILIDAHDRAVLCDFGLARDVDEPQGFGLVGTWRYMSPEQATAGALSVDFASDVYSLAVVFHEAITGEAVVGGSSRAEIVRSIEYDAVPPPSRRRGGVPRELDAIFAKALEKNPRKRYASAIPLLEDLGCLLQDRPLAHARESRARRVARALRRRPRTTMLAVMIIVGALAWWVGDRVRRADTIDARIEAVSRFLAQGRDLAALEATESWLNEAASDRRLAAAHEKAVLAGAPAFRREFMAWQGFVLAEDPVQRHRDHARRARRHHALRPHVDFAVVIAFSMVLDDDGDSGAFIDAAQRRFAGNELLRELAPLGRFGERPIAAEPTQPPRDPDAWCLRTYRRLRAVSRHPAADRARRRKAILAQSEAELSNVLELEPDHRLARTLRASIRRQLGSLDAAIEDLDILQRQRTLPGREQILVDIYAVAARLAKSMTTKSSAGHEVEVRSAASVLARMTNSEKNAAAYFTSYLPAVNKENWPVALAFLESWLSLPEAVNGLDVPRFANFLVRTMEVVSEAAGNARLLTLARAFAARASAAALATTDGRSVQAFHAWACLETARDAVERSASPVSGDARARLRELAVEVGALVHDQTTVDGWGDFGIDDAYAALMRVLADAGVDVEASRTAEVKALQRLLVPERVTAYLEMMRKSYPAAAESERLRLAELEKRLSVLLGDGIEAPRRQTRQRP